MQRDKISIGSVCLNSLKVSHCNKILFYLLGLGVDKKKDFFLPLAASFQIGQPIEKLKDTLRNLCLYSFILN